MNVNGLELGEDSHRTFTAVRNHIIETQEKGDLSPSQMENLGKQQQQILMCAGAIQAFKSAWKTIGELDDGLLSGSHVWHDAELVVAASKVRASCFEWSLHDSAL